MLCIEWTLKALKTNWNICLQLSNCHQRHNNTWRALMVSLLGSQAIATDAPFFDTGGCQIPSGPLAIIAPDKWALTKEWRVVNPLLIWQSNLIETIHQSHYPLSLLFLLLSFFSCIIHFYHSQLREFVASLSVSLPLELTCTCIVRPMHVCKINTKNIASPCWLSIPIIPPTVQKHISCS